MRRRRSVRGLSAWEVLVASLLGAGMIGGGIAVTQSSTALAASSAWEDSASRHVEQVLRALTDALRTGSLDTVRRADGVTALANGGSDTGITIQRVLGYSGDVDLDAPITYSLDAASGDVVRTQNGVSQTLARGITSLSITRTGDSFTVVVAAHAGPSDDRGRTARGSVTVRTRNP
jgi:hypothetical protein